MKPGVSFLYLLVLSSTAIAESSLFDSWTHNDLKSYVQDQQRSLEKLGSKSYEELKETLSNAWHHDKGKAWWEIFWPQHPSVLPSQPVTEWLFETWPLEELREFAERHGIQPHPEATKDQLVRYLKDNFGLISERLDTSGFYASPSYFEGWSADDFKRWLEEYEIPFEERTEDLLDAVRENIFHVSKAAEDKRLRALTDLDLSKRELFDSSGGIREAVFEDWSDEDLKKWLNSHGIPYSDNVADNRDRLLALASHKRDLLKDDIDWFLEVTRRRSSPFLSKSPEYVASVWGKTVSSFGNAFDIVQNKLRDLITDTFLIDLDNWPRDEVKRFLDSHGISYSNVAGVEQLRDLAREIRDRPLKRLTEKYEQFADGDWYYELKGWVQEKSNNVRNNDYYKWLSSNAESLGKSFQDQALAIGKKVTDDIRNYLGKLGTGNNLFDLITGKTNVPISIKRQSWYEKWSNDVRNSCSRLFGTLIGH